jgi:hypothetical protein
VPCGALFINVTTAMAKRLYKKVPSFKEPAECVAALRIRRVNRRA